MSGKHQSSAFEDALSQAKLLLQQRKFSEADKRLRALSARDAENPDVLGLRGMLAVEQGRRAAAVELLSKSIARGGAPAILRRNLHALLSLAIADGQHSAVKRLLRVPIPCSDKDTILAPHDLEVVISLANQMAVQAKHQKALALLESFSSQIRKNARALELLGALRLAIGQPGGALEALNAARALMPAKPGLLIALAAAATAANDPRAAKRATRDYVSLFPAYLSEPHPDQIMLIGVANWHGHSTKEFSDARRLHFSGNFISQLAGRHQDKYRILSLLLNSENSLKGIASLPTPDIIFNSLVNSELLLRRGNLQKLTTLLGIWDRPVLNHPEKVLETTRSSAMSLYSDIGALTVPRIERLEKTANTAATVERIESAFFYPLIVRGVIEQEGKNTYLVDDRSTLEEAIKGVRAEPYFYVIQFYENRHEHNYYRKIRAAVAGDVIQIVRVDYDADWNVHGRKSRERVAFYQANRHLLEQEAAICEDPDATLGPQVMQTLQAIRSRNPLDVFGIDFDVMSDGTLLFFEANASMNLLSTADPRVDHPRNAERAFMDAFDSLARTIREKGQLPRRAGLQLG